MDPSAFLTAHEFQKIILQSFTLDFGHYITDDSECRGVNSHIFLFPSPHSFAKP